MTQRICQIHKDSHESYGMPRLRGDLIEKAVCITASAWRVSCGMYPGRQLTPLDSLQRFFRMTSCRICLSNVRSATIRFNRAFSSSSIFRRLSSVTPRSPNFFFHV